MRKKLATIGSSAALVVIGVCLGLGCAGMLVHQSRFDYFAAPHPDDAWSSKIAGWQRRDLADEGLLADAEPGLVGAVAGGAAPAGEASDAVPVGDDSDVAAAGEGLRAKYFAFRADRRRALARDLAEWIQAQAKSHYVEDGPIDHWATLEETLRSDGDDCDGLELLTFYALRDLGFSGHEVYRSIVFRPSDGQHHMVTLWFEDRNDPWVVDPTGAMTRGMPRMSELPEWVPLKVFSDSTEYSVRSTRGRPSNTTLAVNP
jgi:hypothetical protein